MDIVEYLRTTDRSNNPDFFNKAADEIEELLYVLERDKDVSEKKWWLDQRAQLAETIDNAKKC